MNDSVINRLRSASLRIWLYQEANSSLIGTFLGSAENIIRSVPKEKLIELEGEIGWKYLSPLLDESKSSTDTPPQAINFNGVEEALLHLLWTYPNVDNQIKQISDQDRHLFIEETILKILDAVKGIPDYENAKPLLELAGKLVTIGVKLVFSGSAEMTDRMQIMFLDFERNWDRNGMQWVFDQIYQGTYLTDIRTN
jgi:hypothetical protein